MCSGGSDWTCLQPGFPIRKSSDHSLVIDSPRLIADSYVLLRFLVPRHPPCALKNLICTKILRCSRPLCSSQHTGGPPPAPTPTEHARRFVAVRVPGRKPARRSGMTPEPSGPNNVSGTAPAPAPVPHRASRSCTEEPDQVRCQLTDVPPVSTRCPTLGDRPGSGPQDVASAP